MTKKLTEEQQQQIDELVEVEAGGGAKAGILGREWCEVCGELKNFHGFVGAMAAHVAGGRFICSPCSANKERGTVGNIHSPQLDRIIIERGFRYCGSCGREVVLFERTPEAAQKLPFTCPSCELPDRGLAARRRYLEHKATQEGGLERTSAYIHWAKREIEEMLSDCEPSED